MRDILRHIEQENARKRTADMLARMRAAKASGDADEYARLGAKLEQVTP